MRQYCKRTSLPPRPKRPHMDSAPFVWADYMLNEQGYDPIYCEFYIYKGTDDKVL